MAELNEKKVICKMQLKGGRDMFSETVSNLLESLNDEKLYTVTLMIEEE